MKTPLLILLCILISSSVFATDTKISQSQGVTVELIDNSGRSEREIPVRIRDVESQKMAQITLLRSKGNEQIWEGFFRIQFFRGDSGLRVLEFLGRERVPYFVYFVTDGNLQKVKLFSTKESLEKYMKSDVDLASPQAVVSLPTEARQVAFPAPPSIAPSTTPSVASQPSTPVKVEAPKVSAEELEARRRAKMLEEEAKLSQVQKEKNRATAEALANKADVLYQKRNYAGAKKLYVEALELDPDNHTYLYRYGVALYKTQDYSQSLVNLSIAEVPENLLLERDYYIALNHMKLKDYDKALEEMIEIREENNPELSPTASFLAGTMEYQRQSFPAARKSMEYVLDFSKDPQMDKAAEEMLEQIDRMESFLASKKEKYRFTFFMGPIYDQNVLNMALNNESTDVQAIRANYGATALGIWQRSMTSDFGTQLAVSDYYSNNTKLQGDATLQATDAMQIELSFPFHQEIATASRNLSWEVLPSVKSIQMSSAGGAREEVIRSTGASTTLAAPLSHDYYLSGKLDVSSDTSYVSTSTGDDSQSGSKYSLTLSPTMLLDVKGERSISTDLSYLLNNAEGKNFRYSRLGVAVSYTAPVFWSSTGILRFDYANQNYGEASSPRADVTYSLSGTLNRKLSKSWNFMSTLQYTVANSDIETYKYNKFMLMGLFTYTLSVQSK